MWLHYFRLFNHEKDHLYVEFVITMIFIDVSQKIFKLLS